MAGEQNLAGTLEGASRSSDMHIDGRYEVWLVLDTNTLMQLPEELLAFHAASKDSILPRSGAFRSIDLDIKYYVPQAVIRELDYRKSEGNADDSSGSIAKKARSAARLLDGSELGEITFESSNERSKACSLKFVLGAQAFEQKFGSCVSEPG
ncbi:hypothetical protein CVIRNUC_002441 [Coccomyxa viridis]|uniref:PIN domain-containing protein n=1 Tax=Coccomyxa viridis TaxID=1274662 RepID=A0AAV1I038_9CHLO|nr:hypothetical protein CVIRNUC_002441 [Coccomyxa viridis]